MGHCKDFGPDEQQLSRRGLMFTARLLVMAADVLLPLIILDLYSTFLSTQIALPIFHSLHIHSRNAKLHVWPQLMSDWRTELCWAAGRTPYMMSPWAGLVQSVILSNASSSVKMNSERHLHHHARMAWDDIMMIVQCTAKGLISFLVFV